MIGFPTTGKNSLRLLDLVSNFLPHHNLAEPRVIFLSNSYSKNSRAYKYLEQIFEISFEEKDLIDAQRILKDWDLKTDFNNRSAALGVCTISPEWLAEQGQRSPPPVETVFRECVDQMNKIYGRLDPLWSERNFLVRGDKKISVQGGPDTLRAIYGRQQKEGYLKAQGGDGLYLSLIHI